MSPENEAMLSLPVLRGPTLRAHPSSGPRKVPTAFHRLKPGGKYEMAAVELREGMAIDPDTVRRLTREAVALNERVGDPTRESPSIERAH